MKSVLIIAEAGVNHGGDVELALQLVDAAADAGADIVKFQTFRTSGLVTKEARRAEYQREGGESDDESQYSLLESLELSHEDHDLLKRRCDERSIEFLSTAFDKESVDFLATLGLRRWKIPSGEITNVPYLRHIARMGGDIVLSTGMATLGEVEFALGELVRAGARRESIVLLHCTSEYPAALEDVNLQAMVTLQQAFQLPVGYSDHTQGIEVAIAAVALGATVVEKHFTLDRSAPGVDQRASLEPEELGRLVTSIRNVTTALGSRTKRPTSGEVNTRKVARKMIVAAKPVKVGEVFSQANLTTKRSSGGISAARWDELIGTTARRNYKTDEQIEQ